MISASAGVASIRSIGHLRSNGTGFDRHDVGSFAPTKKGAPSQRALTPFWQPVF
jgi:hypothetical protein